MSTTNEMLRFIKFVPRAELGLLRLLSGDKLCCQFDCEDQVPVIALFREEQKNIQNQKEESHGQIVLSEGVTEHHVSRFLIERSH